MSLSPGTNLVRAWAASLPILPKARNQIAHPG